MVRDFFFGGAPKSLQMVTAAMKLKDGYSLEGKLWEGDFAGGGSSRGGLAGRERGQEAGRWPRINAKG